MDIKKLEKLFKSGERVNVEFKEDCKAFSVKNKCIKGELVKDICALANTGKKSYLLFGIKDPKTGVKELSEAIVDFNNPKFTDDNLQDFLKKAIYPVPDVNFELVDLTRYFEGKDKKRIGVVEIKPDKGKGVFYCINDDFICYESRCCFRKNEIWVRKGATCCLAFPNDIVRLLKGKSPISDEVGIKYQTLPRSKQKEQLSNDFQDIIRDIDGQIFNNGKYLTLNINDKKFILSYSIQESLNYKFSWLPNVARKWCYEMGRIFLLFKGVRDYAFPRDILRSDIYKINESWGCFYMTKFYPLNSKIIKIVPKNVENSAFFTIVIKNIKRYSDLESKLKSAFNYISEKEDIIKELEKAKQIYVNGIKDWLNEKDEISYKRMKNLSSIDFKTLKQNKTQAQRVIDLFEEKD
jgi:hypothetical protein